MTLVAHPIQDLGGQWADADPSFDAWAAANARRVARLIRRTDIVLLRDALAGCADDAEGSTSTDVDTDVDSVQAQDALPGAAELAPRAMLPSEAFGSSAWRHDCTCASHRWR